MTAIAKAEVVELVRQVFAEVAAGVCDAAKDTLARTHTTGQPVQPVPVFDTNEIRTAVRGAWSDVLAAVTHALSTTGAAKRTSSDAHTQTPKRARLHSSEPHTAPEPADDTAANARAPLSRAAKISTAPNAAPTGTTKNAAAKKGAARLAQPAQPARPAQKDPPPNYTIVTVTRHNRKVMYGCLCSDGSTGRRDFGDLKRDTDSATLLELLSDFFRSDFLAEGGVNHSFRRTVLNHISDISSTLQCTLLPTLCVRTRARRRVSALLCSSRRASSR